MFTALYIYMYATRYLLLQESFAVDLGPQFDQ
jgi:hypothetical protein